MLGYIDPTGGLPPATWLAWLAGALAGAGAAWAAVRVAGARCWRAIRARPRWSLALVLVLLGGVGVARGWFWRNAGSDVRQESAHGRSPRVLVLAFDGFDPRLLEEYFAAGALPHLKRLADEGTYHPLGTTEPPQSPVAWSSFVTGRPPAEHGVADFLCRDAATYQPDLTLADRRRLQLPWRGTPFWDHPAIARHGFIAQRLPMIFPPPSGPARLLAGMGVWDARGTEGTYFFYAPHEPPTDQRGLHFRWERDGETLRSVFPGPYRAGAADAAREPFEFLPADPPRLRWQGQERTLAWDAWSDWLRVEFRLGPLGLERIPTLTRVWPSRAGGHATLYVSPLNFDPRQAPYKLSHPRRYAGELADAIGPYATRGMPFDTQAVNDGVLSDAAFLQQVQSLTDESERMLLHELRSFGSGVLFAYFEASDIVQHMFWRGLDPEHPLHDTPETQTHRDAIPAMYRAFDELLGRARTALGTGEVIVLSDHGFAPFRRAVHLNSVLRELGYLTLKPGAESSADFFADVDWSQTRAYALGLNAVYLNLAGREGRGIVPADEAERLAAALARDLESWHDGDGTKPIARIVRTSLGDRRLPDLCVGFRRGFRASWQTCLGGVPATTTELNRQKWSGDHCIDAAEVPGVFLSSHPDLDAPDLLSVGATLARWLETRESRPGR